MAKKKGKEIKTNKERISEKEANLLVDQGWIRLYVLFEIIGRPKEHVEQKIEEYVKEFSKADMRIVKLERGEAIEAGEDEHGKYYSVVAEADIVVSSPEKILDLAINYTPSHIEIIKPKKIELTDSGFTHFLTDLLQKLHYLNSIAIAGSREIQKNRTSLKLLAMNATILALMTGPKSLEELSKLIGINPAEMKKVVNELVKKGIIEKREEKYYLKPR